VAITYVIKPKYGPFKRNALFHFINGIHSDIPVCCSFFFARKTLDKKCHEEGLAFTISNEREPGAWERGEHDLSANYVQCDKCWENKRVVTINENDAIFRWLHKDEYDYDEFE